MMVCLVFCFFKQKTAYDMRISDWSSDVCSSDLPWTGRTKPELIAAHADLYHAWRAGEYTPEGGETWEAFRARVAEGLRHWLAAGQGDLLAVVHGGVIRAALPAFVGLPPARVIPVTPGPGPRSEERRVGTRGV